MNRRSEALSRVRKDWILRTFRSLTMYRDGPIIRFSYQIFLNPAESPTVFNTSSRGDTQMTICPACQGRRTIPARRQCWTCNGSGRAFLLSKEKAFRAAMIGEHGPHLGVCPRCNGTGKTEMHVYCAHCQGTGQDKYQAV
jgi:hypothetical protein